MPASRLLALLFALAAGAAAGCGGGKPNGALKGAVTLNGAPLKAGLVTAYNEKAEVLAQVMVNDGVYEITNLPLGAVTLVVQTHTLDGQPVTAAKGPAGAKAPPIPEKAKKELAEKEREEKTAKGIPVLPTDLDPVPLKYTSQKDSGLTVTVAKGTTAYDITMTGKGEITHISLPAPGAKGGTPPPPPKGIK